jgi:hypothetical protein
MRDDAGQVAASGEILRRATDDEVVESLRRRRLPLPAGAPRGLLGRLLVGDTRQRIARREGSARLDDDPRVGERVVALARAPAVGHDLARRGRAWRDDAARAHAERVDAEAFYLVHEAVARRGQERVANTRVVLRLIDDRLRVLDAHAEREVLAFDADALTCAASRTHRAPSGRSRGSPRRR